MLLLANLIATWNSAASKQGIIFMMLSAEEVLRPVSHHEVVQEGIAIQDAAQLEIAHR